MRKLYRSLLWTGFVAIAVAACGDDVTVTNPPPPPPPPEGGIRSVTVGPDGATIPVGGTQQMTAAVTTDPGVATPSIAWSTSSAATASVSTGGLVTGVAAGAASITATATSGTSQGQGQATVNVAAASCVVSSVTATPGSATLVVGQTVQATSGVNFTGPCTGAVTWSDLTPAIASVSATGLITAVAGGNAVITVTSDDDATKSAAIAISVVVPSPATLSIEKVEYNPGGGSVPVLLTNVFGQIEVTANVDQGDATLDRLDVTIDGQVVATQIYPQLAPAASGPSLAPVQNTISVNTAQVRLVGTLFAPVVFNGNRNIGLNLYVVGSTTPIVSNTVPVVMNNPDAVTTDGANGAIGVALTNPAANTFTDGGGTTWWQSNVDFSGITYMAFGGVNPISVTAGNTLGCANSNVVSGTPTTGVSITGTWDCAGLEGAVGFAGPFLAAVTVGAPPAPEVTVTAPTGWSRVSTAFVVGDDNIAAPTDPRYNLLTGGTAASSAFNVDWLAPTTLLNMPIGFHAGTLAGGDLAPDNCEETGVTPGCWINASGPIASRFTTTDGGSGAFSSASNTTTVRDYTGGGVSCAGTVLPTGTGADYADNTVANSYMACAHGVDPVGNANSQTVGAGGAAASNAFSVDTVNPTFTYAGTYDVAGTVDPAVVNLLPGLTLDYAIIDDNSGIDGTDQVGIQLTLTQLVNNGGTPSTTFCATPSTLLDGASPGVQMLNAAFAEDNGCGLPGQYTWTASGWDRAGNSPTPAIVRQLEYNPSGAEFVTAVNVLPLYGAAADISWDIFATDDEDLSDADVGLSYVTSSGATINVVFGPQAGFYSGVFGASWDDVLTLATAVTGFRLTLPAAYNLYGYADDASVLPGTPPWSTTGLNFSIFDTFGAQSPLFNMTIAAPFLTATSWTGNTANPWTAGTGTANETFTTIPGDATSCAWTYETPTNNPAILTRIWAANDDGNIGPTTYTLIGDVNSLPILQTDNGVTRVYRHNITDVDTCVFFGINQIMAIQSNVAWVF